MSFKEKKLNGHCFEVFEYHKDKRCRKLFVISLCFGSLGNFLNHKLSAKISTKNQEN